jgi:hypothetical protein
MNILARKKETFAKKIAREQAFYSLIEWRIAAARKLALRHGPLVSAKLLSAPMASDMQADPAGAFKAARTAVHPRRLLKIFAMNRN